MSDKEYPRGSEWRKWDLHLHSPNTALNNNFMGSSVQEKWDNYVAKLETLPDTAVLGITDYFSIDGYIKLLEYKRAGRLKNIDLILPNVEFRMLPVTAAERPINIHFILSPEIVNEVEARLFQSLEFSFNGSAYKCTRNDLIRLGQAFNADRTVLTEQQQYEAGVNQFKITLSDLGKVLKNNPDFAKHCVVAVSNSSNDGNSGIQEDNMSATRQEIYRFASIIFSGNPKDVNYFLGKGVDSPEIVISKYGGLKPCVIGSDAHELGAVGVFTLGRNTWIKANPTFEGLKQIVNEPATRVFIGEEPLSLIQQKQNPTRIIEKVEVRASAASPLKNETWFETVAVPLNAELVAIIGNKGSGKSALSDIIGLLGNSEHIEHFSFLHEKKFKKDKKASHFEAQLSWADGTPSKQVNLDSERNDSDIETVKYIPQLYLENICSEIASSSDQGGSSFYSELEKVIFSHVPRAEQLECSSLRELIAKQTAQTKALISNLIGKLWDKNKSIILLEDKLTSEHKAILQAKFDAKKNELIAIEARKPKAKLPPAADTTMSPEIQAIASSLELKQKELEKIDAAINKTNAQLVAATSRYAKLEKIKSKISIFINDFKVFEEDLAVDLESFGLKFDDIVKLNPINVSGIEQLIEQEQVAKTTASTLLDIKNPEGYFAIQKSLQTQIKSLESQLAAPQREYQAYLAALKQWQADKDSVTGENSDEFLETENLKAYKNELSSLENLPEEYKRNKLERTQIVLSIFKEKNNLCECLRKYCKYAQDSLADYEITRGNGFVEFHVAITEKGFVDGFLENISQLKSGSFQGKEPGKLKLNQLLKGSDFGSETGVRVFIEELERLLVQGSAGQKVTVRSQLKQNSSIEDFYRYIYSLEYLKPEYSIRWDGKPLESLSAGERGNLLLIFFLLIAKDPRPLLIDQPEDNLDNQTIYKTLVPCINEAKKRRQIIMVTHNPNLAVVCDADQVIYSQIEKENKNKVVYVSGAIEDAVINKHILDVLEGTRPAFDARDNKYQEKAKLQTSA